MEFAKKIETCATATWDEEAGHWVVIVSSITYVGDNDKISKTVTINGAFVTAACEEFVVANSLLRLNGVAVEGVIVLDQEKPQINKIV